MRLTRPVPPILAGCGVTSLYASAGVAGSLSSVALYTPGSRTGFFLQQSPQDELATNVSGASLYRMDCTTLERRSPLGARVNNVANRYEINLTVRAVQQAAIEIRLALWRYFAGRPAAALAITETPAAPNPQDALH